MSFHEIRFPTDISYGSSGGPEFSTDIIITHSGHEQRNINWSEARARFNVAHGVKTKTQLDELIAFFRARKGMAHGFRFKDWSDYKVENQLFAVGTGAETQFQLKKTYASSVSVSRDIKKIVAGTVKVYFGAVEQLSGWSVDVNSGIVTFTAAPTNGAQIKASFEFDIPVRFDTDRLSARMDDYGVNSWSDIPLVEIRA
jgi:uncharacterized protein (TIGR02217 family)